MKNIRAFIDLGTNTFHLLIAAIEHEKFEILYRTKAIVGLGAGGINDGLITAEAIKRGLNCLINFKATCTSYQVQQINAFGTSALRSARNSMEFISLVQEKTGFLIEVIDGNREAELIQLGISSSLDHLSEPYLIMDIGGGSTEFILVKDGSTLKKQSFEVGVQRLISTFYSEDPIPQSDFDKLILYLDDFLDPLVSFKEFEPQVLVGASGTYTTLLRMYAKKRATPQSFSTKVPTDFFADVFKQLLTLPREERLLMPGMSAPRVDLIVVGSCLVHYVLKLFSFDGFVVSDNGLKEGAMLLASKGKL